MKLAVLSLLCVFLFALSQIPTASGQFRRIRQLVKQFCDSDSKEPGALRRCTKMLPIQVKLAAASCITDMGEQLSIEGFRKVLCEQEPSETFWKCVQEEVVGSGGGVSRRSRRRVENCIKDALGLNQN